MGGKMSQRFESKYRKIKIARKNRAINTILSFSTCAILAIVATLAIVSNRSDGSATDSKFIFTIEPSLAIFLDSDNVETNIIPSPDGTVSSLQTDVRVVSIASEAYQLSLRSMTADMIGASNSSNTLSPISNGTIESPVPFTTSNCNAWGFATPRVPGNFTNDFDSDYSVLNNQSVLAVSSNYSAVPTTNTAIHFSPETDETRPYYFAFCIQNTIQPDSYSATVVWSVIAETLPTEPPVPPMAENGDLIQDVTNETCPTTRTWVVDARDNRTYWIQKIPNSGAGGTDLCWMQTNLAYAGGGNNGFGDVKTLTQNTSGGLGNSPAGYRVSNPPSGAPVFTTSPTPPTTGSGANTGANGAQYGYLYNWCAAMGGQSNACNNTSTTGFNTTVSICPSGWRLPVGNATDDANVNDFSALNNAVNSGSTTSDAELRSNWFGVYAGNLVAAGNFSLVGSYGQYWSSTVNNATYAHSFSFRSPSVIPASNSLKTTGIAVRCVQ